jgi:hypothetical protein
MYPGAEEAQKATLRGIHQTQDEADRKLLTDLESMGVHVSYKSLSEFTQGDAKAMASGQQTPLSNGKGNDEAGAGWVSNKELDNTVLPHDVSVVTDWKFDQKTGKMTPVYSTLKAGQNTAMDAVVAHGAGMQKFNDLQAQYTAQLNNDYKKAQTEKELAEAAKARAEGSATNSEVLQTTAQQLVEGNEDPSQLSKRSKTYDATLAAANKYSMEKYGKPFNLAQAQSDYMFAKSPATQNVIKYSAALTSPGGNLDRLKQMSAKWARTQFPKINEAAAWAKLQTGNPDIAALYAQLVAVQDEYAKILSGASGGAVTSDSARQQAIDVINQNLANGQIQAVAETMRNAVNTRMREFVGKNRYLTKQYPELAVPAGATQIASGSDGKEHYLDAQGKDLGIVGGP